MFVPRSVKSKLPKAPVASAPAQPAKSGDPPHPPAPHAPAAPPRPPPTVSSSASSSKQLPDEEIAALIELVFSDHSLSNDAHSFDLVGKLGRNGGFIRLCDLLLHPHLAALVGLPGAAVTRSLRIHGTKNFLETRICLIEPRAWGSNKAASSDGASGIEIGLQGWSSDLRSRVTQSQDWSTRTLYIEYLPAGLRSLPEILVFLRHLLPRIPSRPAIQSLSFHRRHFQNFAWLVLAEEPQARAFADEWPWLKRAVMPQSDDSTLTDESHRRKDAASAGFRVIPSTEYLRLEELYLSALEASSSLTSSSSSDPSIDLRRPRSASTTPAPSRPPASRPIKPVQASLENIITGPDVVDFPPGRLVFVKRVHPHSSRTSLKALLQTALQSGALGEIDYIDWSKGNDSCHVRVSSPSASSALSAFFSSTFAFSLPASSSSGPSVMAPSSETLDQPVEVEVLSGARERIYWMESVKESIRVECVRKMGEGSTLA